MKSILLYLILIVSTLILFSCDDSSNTDNAMVIPKEFVFDNVGKGCSNFVIYEINEQFYSIHVSGSRDSLGVSTTLKTFDFPNDNLQVVVNQFDGFIGNYFCDDVLGDEGTILNSYSPVSGSSDIVITQDSIIVNEWEVIYEISVSLNDLIFEVDDTEVTIENLTFSNVRVGWFPG